MKAVIKEFEDKKPSLPQHATNGWGPNYPSGMSGFELLVYDQGLYDQWRTNGAWEKDPFYFDPVIGEYGMLASAVSIPDPGVSDLWWMPAGGYPLGEISNYNNKNSQHMGPEKHGMGGYFHSLDQESRLLSSSTVNSTKPKPTSVKASPSTPKPIGHVNAPLHPISSVPKSRGPSTVVILPAPGYLPPPSTPGGGGGGGGSDSGSETGDQTTDAAKTEGLLPASTTTDCSMSYLPVLIGLVVVALIGYFIAKKSGKDVKKYSIIAGIIGAILGYLYSLHQCKPIAALSKLGIKSKSDSISTTTVAPVPAQTNQASTTNAPTDSTETGNYCGACGGGM